MKTSLLTFSVASAVALAAGLLTSSPAPAAVEYPWCAITSLNLGTPACDYSTIDQCRASIVGGGGFCQPNPRASVQVQMPRRGAR
jgi:hypothetical protein